MLQALLLGVLAPATLGLPAPAEPQPRGSQCVEHDCFALFPGPATFPAASRACERLRGHLMTVRSSVAADVISLLLSGGGGGGGGPRLWIGLQLPPGCSDPGRLGALRGFQWVTGDNRTSYSRWARRREARAPLCGPLCVAVSAAGAPAPGEPAWEEQPCAAEADGFLCEFHFAAACRPLAVEPDAAEAASTSVSYRTPFGSRGADFQALPLGSSAAVAPFGVELLCEERPGEADGRWGRAEPGAWDCGVERGGCQHACQRDAGASRCVCPPDSALGADGRSCAAPGEHSCTELCEHFCVPSPDVPGSYSCMCETGYQLAADQHRCEDVDDCKQMPSLCPQLCVNTEGGFQCRCHPGYDLVDGECLRFGGPLLKSGGSFSQAGDPFSRARDPCNASKCEYQCQPEGHTHYHCLCPEGFVPDAHDPHKCRMFCNETACPADCDPNEPRRCWCPDGYILDENFMCADIDECDDVDCAGECRNLPGSFQCICGPDSPLAGQAGPDCNPVKVDGGHDGGSGEPPASPTPLATPKPPPAGAVPSGVLIGIAIASLSLVVALLALLCHLRKKQGAPGTELEYKCGAPAKEVVLQQVRTEQTPQKL